MANKSTLPQRVRQSSDQLLIAAFLLHSMYHFNHTPFRTKQAQAGAAELHRKARGPKLAGAKQFFKQYFLILPYILTQNSHVWIYFLAANLVLAQQLVNFVRAKSEWETSLIATARRNQTDWQHDAAQRFLREAAALVSMTSVNQTFERSGT
jgi:hypothetical protein